ncbi:MAG: cupin domain-containing protein [Chitinophagaceae bacterium]|nr:cupin domain-containing protein [Chitinophagaceae bacterium]
MHLLLRSGIAQPNLHPKSFSHINTGISYVNKSFQKNRALRRWSAKHIHTDFDETFQVENGELTVWVNGEIRKLVPGEVLHIPKGIPHKPYNTPWGL